MIGRTDDTDDKALDSRESWWWGIAAGKEARQGGDTVIEYR